MQDCIKKLKINGCELYPTNSVKYLGVLLDEHMTWEPHFLKLNAALTRANKLLSKARYYLPPHLLLQLYYGQFYSRMAYACQVWGDKVNQNSQVSVLQRKAVRIITFSDYRAQTDTTFKELKIIKITDLIDLNCMLFVHNILNENVPNHFLKFLVKNAKNHRYNTVKSVTSQYSLPVGSVKIPLGSNKKNVTVSQKCAVTWNSLLKVLSAKHLQDLKKMDVLKITTNCGWKNYR